MNILSKKLQRAFELTYDLASSLSESDLKLKLDTLPSNKIGDQLWCMVGARESYAKAIINSKWMGFACSLSDRFSKEAILHALTESEKTLFEFLESHDLNEEQVNTAFDLLEHEIQHHGQLIRYVYGNKLTFPKSWNDRYTV